MAHIQIRIDHEDKKAAQEVLEKLGLNLSNGIKLFLKQVVQEQKIPFEISAAKKTDTTTNTISSEPNSSWTGFQKHKIG
jgi:DNA-damage-inducible protein J